MASWVIKAGIYEAESLDGALPSQINMVEAWAAERDYIIPLPLYPLTVTYSRNNAESVLAATYKFLEELSGISPTIEAEGIAMPGRDAPLIEGAAY